MAFAFAVNLPLTLAYEQPHSFGGFLGSLYHFVASLCMVAVQMLAPDGWRFNEMADGGLAWQSAVRSTLEGLVCVGFAVGLHLYIVVPMQVAMTGPDGSPFLKFGVVAVLSVLLSFGAARLSRRVPGIRRVLGAAPPPAVTTADLPP
ncbi:MAG: hypothetical protein WCG47_01740 [Dermatophilaceae bacterium]